MSDERVWMLRYDTRTRGYNVEGPSIAPWDLEVVTKASLDAAKSETPLRGIMRLDGTSTGPRSDESLIAEIEAFEGDELCDTWQLALILIARDLHAIRIRAEQRNTHSSSSSRGVCTLVLSDG